eukprot:11873476-Alexandrium_andersonii.AAC.1
MTRIHLIHHPSVMKACQRATTTQNNLYASQDQFGTRHRTRIVYTGVRMESRDWAKGRRRLGARGKGLRGKRPIGKRACKAKGNG